MQTKLSLFIVIPRNYLPNLLIKKEAINRKLDFVIGLDLRL